MPTPSENDPLYDAFVAQLAMMWKATNHPSDEMREKGMSEQKITSEMLEIEKLAWKITEQE
jgi:hypothetical protein